MSRVLLESFFPALTKVLKTHTAQAYSALFPDDVAELCPEIVVVVATPANYYYYYHGDGGNGAPTTIRNPVLLVWALVGACGGLYGGVSLWRNQKPQFSHNNTNNTILWSLPFLFFWSHECGGHSLALSLSGHPASLTATTVPVALALGCLLYRCLGRGHCHGMSPRVRGATTTASPSWTSQPVVVIVVQGYILGGQDA